MHQTSIINGCVSNADPGREAFFAVDGIPFPAASPGNRFAKVNRQHIFEKANVECRTRNAECRGKR
jgi:hypothetical protein